MTLATGVQGIIAGGGMALAGVEVDVAPGWPSVSEVQFLMLARSIIDQNRARYAVAVVAEPECIEAYACALQALAVLQRHLQGEAHGD